MADKYVFLLVDVTRDTDWTKWAQDRKEDPGALVPVEILGYMLLFVGWGLTTTRERNRARKNGRTVMRARYRVLE